MKLKTILLIASVLSTNILYADKAQLTAEEIIKKSIELCLAEESKKGTKITPFNPSHLAKIKALNECENCNLNGADLSNMVFVKTKFKGSSLICTNFNNSKLFRIRFDETNLTGASFQNIRSGWHEDRKEPGIKFINANLENTDFTNADMRDSDFKGANLGNANLETAILKDAEMKEAIFCNTKTPWGIDNRGCKRLAIEKLEAERKAKVKTEEAIPQNTLKLKAFNRCVECNLSGVDLTDANLSEANLRYANLRGANLSKADLRSADFMDANLSGANLEEANLEEVNFTKIGAFFVRADLTDANLKGANLEDADLRYANLTNANLTNANLTEADLRYANLTGANLTGANLRDAETKGAIFCNTKTPWGLDNSGCK